MNLLELKYFQTVAKYEHMTYAANKLHIAQPSLSKSISRLEKDLGVRLFDRQGRQIKLNRFGKLFLPRVNKIFLELENAKRELSDMMENGNSKISIASNNIFSNNMFLVNKFLKRYLKLYPNISFSQTIGPINKLKEQLKNGIIDFCFSSPPIEDTSIESIPLNTEEIFLIVSQKHKFANFNSIKLIEAANEPFISLNKGSSIRDLTEKLCAKAGFVPNIIFECTHPIKLLELVNNGIGISLFPVSEWINLKKTQCAILHVKEPICNQTIALSFVKNRYFSQTDRHFKDYITNYFFSKNIK